MSSGLVYLGITHRTAPLEIRERFRVRAEQEETLLRQMDQRATERLVLSTCGRFELYAVSDTPDPFAWTRWLADWLGQPVAVARENVVSKRGRDAAIHCLRVAAGLDSQIVGEPQILQQVREAFLRAEGLRAVGPVLSALCRAAIHAGRRVRRETALNRPEASFARRAVDYVASRVSASSPAPWVIVGSGSMAAEVGQQASARGASRLIVVNRRAERAGRLAAMVGGIGVGWEQLTESLRLAQAVIVCTSSSSAVIDAQHLTPRSGRPLVIVDLGMPRNVAPAVGALPGVHLAGLDALRDRDEAVTPAVEHAERLVQQEMDRLQRWCDQRRERCALTDDVLATGTEAEQPSKLDFGHPWAA